MVIQTSFKECFIKKSFKEEKYNLLFLLIWPKNNIPHKLCFSLSSVKKILQMLIRVAIFIFQHRKYFFQQNIFLKNFKTQRKVKNYF